MITPNIRSIFLNFSSPKNQKIKFINDFSVPKLLKYSFLVFLKSFLPNYVVYCSCFLWVKDLDFKYFFLNLDRFIISLCKFFIIKGASIDRIYFFLIEAYLLKTERVVSLKLFISFLSNPQVFMSAWNLSLSKFL